MENKNNVILGDNMDVMPTLEADSIDCIVTDPPYGLSFMGKNWDKAVPSIAIWQKCLRVLKPGAFAFVMCIPRQDCLARMICRLEDAGFNVAFSSIYWTYATGFPKAQNLSKVVDKRAGVKREVIDEFKTQFKTDLADKRMEFKYGNTRKRTEEGYRIQTITTPSTDQAKALDGAYGGFQPKPAVEIIIVAMKSLSERTYIDQAISNGHGCTWLDECRVPFKETDWDASKKKNNSFKNANVKGGFSQDGGLKGRVTSKGRFPANVLCEDDVLSNGNVTKSMGGTGVRNETNVFKGTEGHKHFNCGDRGSFSRYFSLDAWFSERIKSLPKEAQKTFPWLIVPKASKEEKNHGLLFNAIDNGDKYGGKFPCSKADKEKMNKHPTCKPIKLMSRLITLGAREGDIVLDPFLGSGTTMIAAKMLGRYCIGIEKEKEYFDLATLRCNEFQKNINEYF